MARNPQSGKRFRRVSDVITDHGTSLGKLLQRANLLIRVEHIISDYLESSTSEHFQVGAIRENRLILISPSASWATRLRMEAPGILRSLHSSGYTRIEHIDIRVAPLVEQPQSPRKRRTLSAAALQALAQMAQLEADDKD